MIMRRLVVGQLTTNCYVIGSGSGKEGLVIDPGDEAERILDTINELALDIKLILLTHGHWDHTGALKEVKQATGAKVAIHGDDAGLIHEQSLANMMGFYYPDPPDPDWLLKDGDEVDVGDLHFNILHTPGHSPGCICILGDGVVFSGDTLFAGGIGRYDLPGSDYDALMNSIATKLMTLPDDTLVYPGHGAATTIGTERQGNPFLNG